MSRSGAKVLSSDIKRSSGSAKPSFRMSDIARLANVSVSAVSLALNGKPGVSEETRQRILEIAKEGGWFPNAAARALVGARTQTIGLVITRKPEDIGIEPFYMSFFAGVESPLSDAGKALLMQFSPTVHQEIETYRRWVAEQRIDGLVLIDLMVNDPRPAILQELGIPFVVAGSPQYAPGCWTTWVDDAEAIHATVRRLAELGHTGFARVNERSSMAHTTIRNAALVNACREFDLPSPALVECEPSVAGSRQATSELLGSARRPTAVIYDNSVMAVSGLGVAAEMGVDVPGELSLVAYDDSLLCESTSPSLSAVSHNVYEFGVATGKTLLDALDGGEPQQILYSIPEFVERGSTGPLNDN